MENNEKKRVSVLVEETGKVDTGEKSTEGEGGKARKLRKPLVFVLMGFVFAGCMYLIFKPSGQKKKADESGMNDSIPQATGAGIQSDKQKAYEQASMEKKDQDDRSTLASLSDYWRRDSLQNKDSTTNVYASGSMYRTGNAVETGGGAALNSYRNAQSALGNFYQDDHSETEELRKQVGELKEKLAEKGAGPPINPIDNQLALMEKSYQMAAKYLPSNNNGTTVGSNPTGNSSGVDTVKATPRQKESVAAFTAKRKAVVSALYREPSDSGFTASVNGDRNRGFYTAGSRDQVVKPNNSVLACIQETQTVSGEGGVKTRLLEDAVLSNLTLPAGSVVTANAKYNGGRVQLKISSIEYGGNIVPVDITVYDLDGQPGLNVPYSPEMNALTEIASNMGQASGTSIMMTQSAGQQMAGDLSRGLVQGVSGYFSKKVRTPKVTLKAGYRLFLVSKN